MRMTWQVSLLTSVAVAAVCQPGCLFFQKEYVPGVDPEAGSFDYVYKVRGNTLILYEGESVTLEPLIVAPMSEYQRDRLATTLKQMASYPYPPPKASKASRGLLVRNFGESRQVLLSVPYAPLMHICGLRISLLPIRIPVPPTHVDVVEHLLKGGMAKLDPKAVPDPARLECYSKAENSAKTLGLGVWASPGEQLLEAVRVGNVGEVERLLKLGAPTDYVGKKFPPQTDAERSSQPYPFHRPPLNLPWRARNYRHEGQTPLMVAVQWWRRDIARILLRHGARPVTALHHAAQFPFHDQAKRMEMLKMLVEAGADVRAADAEHRLINVPMFSNGQWETIDYLHSRGASIEAFEPVKHGSHLLVDAAVRGNVPNAERLIEFRADVNGLSQRGVYPLSAAARAGYLAIAKLLLDAGADPNRKDRQGKTPLQHARSRKNNTLMIALLTKHGAK